MNSYLSLKWSLTIVLIHRITSSSVPESVAITPIGPGYVEVKWRAPTAHEGKLSGYWVLYTRDKSQIDRKWDKIQVNGRTYCMLTNLVNHVKYFIKVKPILDKTITGQSSDVHEFIISDDNYSKQMIPTIANVREGTHSSIVFVHWRAPDYLDSQLLRYEIHYGPSNSQYRHTIVIDKSNIPDFDQTKRFKTKITGLMGNTEYEFAIKVKTIENLGGINSEKFKFKTNYYHYSNPNHGYDRNQEYFLRNLLIILNPNELLKLEFIIPAILLLSPIWLLVIAHRLSRNRTINYIYRNYSGTLTNLDKANQLYYRGQYRAALNYFTASLNEATFDNFDLDEIYYKMAVCSSCLNELGSCLRYCDRALFYNYDHIDAFRLKGDTLTKMNMFAEAYFIYQVLYMKRPTLEHQRLLFEARSRLSDHNRMDDTEDSDTSDSEPSVKTKTKEQCFQILELRIGANDSEIRSAYRRKLLENHPDKHPNATELQRRLLNDKTRDITEAYKVLTNNSNN